MYKQRCVGTEGPLMPMVFMCACGLILYSATDAGVRALRWPLWAFAICAGVFVLAGLIIYRYTRVEMEYVWFGGELIVRRHEGGHITRLVVRRQAICGIRSAGECVGTCVAGRTHNCCATLHGRLTCSTVYYHDEGGRAFKLLLQPNPELRELLWEAASETPKDQKA